MLAKLYNRVLLNRLRPVLDPLLRMNQNGFRPGRCCPEHILCLRRLIESFKVKGGGGVIVFIDFRKAFDSLHRECIPPLLAAYGVPLTMIRGIMALYTDTTAIVLTWDGHTDPFHVSNGNGWWGCPLFSEICAQSDPLPSKNADFRRGVGHFERRV